MLPRTLEPQSRGPKRLKMLFRNSSRSLGAVSAENPVRVGCVSCSPSHCRFQKNAEMVVKRMRKLFNSPAPEAKLPYLNRRFACLPTSSDGWNDAGPRRALELASW